MNKIFLCYTLRGKDFNIKSLKTLKKQFEKLDNYSFYIDRLDNEIANTDLSTNTIIQINENTLNSKYQQILRKNLLNTDILCIIKSDRLHSSEWVTHERIFAKQNKLLEVCIDKKDWNDFLQIDNTLDLLKSNFINNISQNLQNNI